MFGSMSAAVLGFSPCHDLTGMGWEHSGIKAGEGVGGERGGGVDVNHVFNELSNHEILLIVLR